MNLQKRIIILFILSTISLIVGVIYAYSLKNSAIRFWLTSAIGGYFFTFILFLISRRAIKKK